jgi:hypothetical protein
MGLGAGAGGAIELKSSGRVIFISGGGLDIERSTPDANLAQGRGGAIAISIAAEPPDQRDAARGHDVASAGSIPTNTCDAGAVEYVVEPVFLDSFESANALD